MATKLSKFFSPTSPLLNLVTIDRKIKRLRPKEIYEKNLSNQFSEPVRSAQIPSDIWAFVGFFGINRRLKH